jgi:hypothetical protein
MPKEIQGSLQQKATEKHSNTAPNEHTQPTQTKTITTKPSIPQNNHYTDKKHTKKNQGASTPPRKIIKNDYPYTYGLE